MQLRPVKSRFNFRDCLQPRVELTEMSCLTIPVFFFTPRGAQPRRVHNFVATHTDKYEGEGLADFHNAQIECPNIFISLTLYNSLALLSTFWETGLKKNFSFICS